MEQIRRRAQTIICTSGKIEINTVSTIDRMIEKISASTLPDVVIVDSLSNLRDPRENSSAGGIKQMKCCGTQLMAFAKKAKFCIIMVAHVSKAGTIAGPEGIEHLADVVMYLDGIGTSQQRYLQCVKNRYSSTDEIGLLAMEEHGLFPSSLPVRRLTSADVSCPGCASTVVFLKRIPL